MHLGNLAQGRDNNLNLLRILASLAVLISHSFALSTGDPNNEPLRQWIGMTPGTIAVDIFFVVSGFLVTASIMKSEDILDFLVARCLRIFPALLAVLAATVFLLGPIFTESQLSSSYWEASFRYFAKCATLFLNAAYTLPGVFEGNPYPSVINGSLWTMTWELRSYMALLAVWWLSQRFEKARSHTLLVMTIAIAASLYCRLQYLRSNDLPASATVTPLLMFTLGATMWQLRDKIPLSHKGLISSITLLAISPLATLQLFHALYPIAIAYIVMYAAFVPTGLFREYNRIGDYSYGIYLYAFPTQQLLAAVYPGITTWNLTIISVMLTTLCAACSWHVIEKPALKNKGNVLEQLRLLYSKFP